MSEGVIDPNQYGTALAPRETTPGPNVQVGTAVAEPESSLSWWKDLTSIAQSVAMTLAIIAAAIWFFWQREPEPKANIAHSVTHRQLNRQWTWVNVSITISNVGKRLLNLTSGNVRLDHVLPLDKPIAEAIEAGPRIIAEGQVRVIWPSIAGPYKTPLNLQIEPGESDSLDYEFIIPNSIRTVRVYSYFAKQESPPLGWKKVSIYDIRQRGGKP
jgi:hypothetical protein